MDIQKYVKNPFVGLRRPTSFHLEDLDFSTREEDDF